MATISKNGKNVKNSSLSYKEYKEYRKIYTRAGKIAINFIDNLLDDYGSFLEPEDYAFIENFLPKETDYKTWDIENFKYELSELKKFYKLLGKTYKVYQELLYGVDYREKQDESLFPFYQEIFDMPN